MSIDETMRFTIQAEEHVSAKQVLMEVFAALKEKGYDPYNQIVGYLLSGDPTYITSHRNARSIVRKRERDELLEELVRFYLEHHGDR